MKQKGGPSKDDPTFDETVKRLSEIVTHLERGELPLEESLRLFEEGVKLSRISQAKLDSAQKRVEELLSIDDEGRPVTQAFTARGDDDDDGPV